MSKVPIALLLCFWVVFTLCSKNDYTDNVIAVLERALHYTEQNAKLMNADAFFALSLTQANLQMLIRRGFSDKYNARVRLLNYVTNKTIHQIQPHLQNNSRSLLFQSTIFTAKAWRKPIKFGVKPLYIAYFAKKFKHINTLRAYLDLLANDNIVEADSDNCLIELLEQQRFCCVDHKCLISPKCQKLMIRNVNNILPAYGITHNLLFLQVAKSQKCNFNHDAVNRKIKEYCSYIYWEATKNYEYGFLEDLDDLFLEQVTLCGYEGFTEFLKDDFVEHILSLQADNGCFKMIHSQEEVHRRRRKKEINILDHGCADHTTGLGIASLSIILRYQLTT